MPKYSLIIPVYNAEKYLASLFNQLDSISYADIEIIFVNDGSTDHSKELLEKYAESKNVKVITKENGGPGLARNTGFENASGDFIWFVDADDRINTASFAEYDRIIAACPEVEMICHKFVSIGEPEKFSFSGQTDPSWRKISNRFAMHNTSFAPWTRVFKRSFLMENSFSFPPSSYAEDVAVTVEMCCKAKCIVYTDLIAYGYFINPKSISNSKVDRYEKDMLASALRMKEIMSQNPDFHDDIEWIMYYHTRDFLKKLQKNGLPGSELQKIVNEVPLEYNVYGRMAQSYENSRWYKLGEKISNFVKLLYKSH
ncbi:MAG: glycosyltransferase [Treponema sp.]|nr:glycosyltransferase [Treponema sp.]